MSIAVKGSSRSNNSNDTSVIKDTGPKSRKIDLQQKNFRNIYV